MLHRGIRWFLLLVLAAALASTVLTAAKIASDPAISPYEPATQAEILANTGALMVERATPLAIAARLRERLNDTPRNWLSLAMLTGLAERQGITLPPDITDALAIAQEDDFGLYAFAAPCTACAADPTSCPYAQLLICNDPFALPPAADLNALHAAALKATDGAAQSQAEVAFAIIALQAEPLAARLSTSAEALRDGARLASFANRLARLSPALTALASETATDGVDWGALTNLQTPETLPAAIRIEAFLPLAQLVLALNQLNAARNPKMSLQLLPMIDNARDAAQMTAALNALGPDLIVTSEVLGKDTLLRATHNLSKTAWITVAGLAGIWISLAILAAGWLRRRADRRSGEPDDEDAE